MLTNFDVFPEDAVLTLNSEPTIHNMGTQAYLVRDGYVWDFPDWGSGYVYYFSRKSEYLVKSFSEGTLPPAFHGDLIIMSSPLIFLEEASVSGDQVTVRGLKYAFYLPAHMVFAEESQRFPASLLWVVGILLGAVFLISRKKRDRGEKRRPMRKTREHQRYSEKTSRKSRRRERESEDR